MGEPQTTTWVDVLKAAQEHSEALNELEAHLVKQVKLASGILASRKARGRTPSHYEDDEYRLNRWLDALRDLRAAWDGIEP